VIGSPCLARTAKPLLDPSDPREWLRRARSNLALAQVGRGEDVPLEDLDLARRVVLWASALIEA